MKKILVFAIAAFAAATLVARPGPGFGPRPGFGRMPPPPMHHHHHHHSSGGAIAAGIVGGAILGGIVSAAVTPRTTTVVTTPAPVVVQPAPVVVQPAPVVTDDMLPSIKEKIVMPVVRELKRRGITYRGILYAGLMVNNANSFPNGPVAKSGSPVNVVEFNARFGDPETEAVLPRLGGDFATALLHAATGCLKDEDIVVLPEPAATVIVASGGYPGSYEKGKEISGLEGNPATVFHCGTKRGANGETLTSGGRVLSVTGIGQTLREAVDRAYEGVSKISFDGMFFRRDIAHRAFER